MGREGGCRRGRERVLGGVIGVGFVCSGAGWMDVAGMGGDGG